jgi:hypothetical protein
VARSVIVPKASPNNGNGTPSPNEWARRRTTPPLAEPPVPAAKQYAAKHRAHTRFHANENAAPMARGTHAPNTEGRMWNRRSPMITAGSRISPVNRRPQADPL